MQKGADYVLYREYIKITHDYPIAAAKAFSTLSDSFNFVYISGEGYVFPLFQIVHPTANYDTLQSRPIRKDLYALREDKRPYGTYTHLTPFLIALLLSTTHLQPQTGLYKSHHFRQSNRSHSLILRKSHDESLSPIVSLAPGLAIPSDKCGEYAVRLACGDGEPVSGLSGEKEGVLDGGRTLRNSAIRKGLGL